MKPSACWPSCSANMLPFAWFKPRASVFLFLDQEIFRSLKKEILGCLVGMDITSGESQTREWFGLSDLSNRICEFLHCVKGNLVRRDGMYSMALSTFRISRPELQFLTHNRYWEVRAKTNKQTKNQKTKTKPNFYGHIFLLNVETQMRFFPGPITDLTAHLHVPFVSCKNANHLTIASRSESNLLREVDKWILGGQYLKDQISTNLSGLPQVLCRSSPICASLISQAPAKKNI